MDAKDNKKIKEVPEKVPDESGQILLTSHVKIFDPNSGEVLLNKRDDE